MAINTILLITLALLVALGFAFYQYLFKKPVRVKKDYIFFALRFLAVFIILLLLINPKITRTKYTVEKPSLYILADNSESIKFLNSKDTLKELQNLLLNDKALQDRFEIARFSFGKNLLNSDSLDFSSTGSDLFQALSEVSEISKNRNSAIIFLSDANQTSGRDFRYFKKSGDEELFPVIIGDTANYSDLSISRINTNRYAFLNNNFPVEIFVNYNGDKEVTSELQILQNGKVLFSKDLSFDQQNGSAVINTNIPVKSLGVKSYKAVIKALPNEKNITNNGKNFAVQVIDERTKVLLLSSIEHPDLGAIKKSIESNSQRSLDLIIGNIKKPQFKDYQLIIIYQPNNQFISISSQIESDENNFLLITGTETDWDFINSLDLGVNKKSAGPPQEIFPVYNKNFSAFQFEDIGFDDLPPLSVKFGKVEYDQGAFDVMLFQKMQGVTTDEPLLAVSKNSPKKGFLLGEGIWRWRAKSFRETQSFREFDDFFSKIIQNLSASRKRERLSLDYNNFYYGNEEVIISAQYYDQNYQLDLNGNLQIHLKDSIENKEITSDFMVRDNFYQFNAGDLPAGTYSFTVSEKGSGIKASGSFEVISYNIEKQFSSANLNAMEDFAENNNTEVFFPDRIDSLKSALLNSSSLKPVQKSQLKSVPLIDWYYLLFLLISVLTVEWFYRKYLGLI
ncbi:hypothetical protein C7S20_13510 [Christiangramia fulva]|uniref:VWA domain-containing protein n=1 Tax=Christiangramia fulva TaxID=2126553 RepID=A0A2R3Z7E7_9FLAO|nr:hypothetical protein [Christiangramia fulva]AVR46193.1 hypothetical protein C7S20_13510 [Christiangramia fulva]